MSSDLFGPEGLGITPEPWVGERDCVINPALTCASEKCCNNGHRHCNYRYYGGELICESISKEANRNLIAAAPEMYRAIAYARQLLLEVLVTGVAPWNDSGEIPTQPSIGRALMLIDAADKKARGIRPLLLLPEKCAA